jgi:hypothetical protein
LGTPRELTDLDVVLRRVVASPAQTRSEKNLEHLRIVLGAPESEPVENREKEAAGDEAVEKIERGGANE